MYSEVQPVVDFVNDSLRVEGRNILEDVHTQHSIQCGSIQHRRCGNAEPDLKHT